ncbi:hypothetical protein FS935_00055 [Metabacillus litoralis]|uniref:Uncharacterized protein n=1 Tax=Metabacillus litoralis TaxID=152268 RepID=A0A5C6W5G8_9BACI|nr:hypothetical protein [Metabacillus litoralis]TXC92644.1 hypothetical protein FS935_00055 [Metabacillus litoralis]
MSSERVIKEVIVEAKLKALKIFNMIRDDSIYSKNNIEHDLLDLINYLDENDIKLKNKTIKVI